mmetsp:Transcript_34389/g.74251  ORF Transcript_34389/g.74251 Transcript_34389/m.74251 type:complete len:673 (+) Transcript_34389:3-2021(+)
MVHEALRVVVAPVSATTQVVSTGGGVDGSVRSKAAHDVQSGGGRSDVGHHSDVVAEAMRIQAADLCEPAVTADSNELSPVSPTSDGGANRTLEQAKPAAAHATTSESASPHGASPHENAARMVALVVQGVVAKFPPSSVPLSGMASGPSLEAATFLLSEGRAEIVREVQTLLRGVSEAVLRRVVPGYVGAECQLPDINVTKRTETLETTLGGELGVRDMVLQVVCRLTDDVIAKVTRGGAAREAVGEARQDGTVSEALPESVQEERGEDVDADTTRRGKALSEPGSPEGTAAVGRTEQQHVGDQAPHLTEPEREVCGEHEQTPTHPRNGAVDGTVQHGPSVTDVEHVVPVADSMMTDEERVATPADNDSMLAQLQALGRLFEAGKLGERTFLERQRELLSRRAVKVETELAHQLSPRLRAAPRYKSPRTPSTTKTVTVSVSGPRTPPTTKAVTVSASGLLPGIGGTPMSEQRAQRLAQRLETGEAMAKRREVKESIDPTLVADVIANVVPKLTATSTPPPPSPPPPALSGTALVDDRETQGSPMREVMLLAHRRRMLASLGVAGTTPTTLQRSPRSKLSKMLATQYPRAHKLSPTRTSPVRSSVSPRGDDRLGASALYATTSPRREASHTHTRSPPEPSTLPRLKPTARVGRDQPRQHPSPVSLPAIRKAWP